MSIHFATIKWNNWISRYNVKYVGIWVIFLNTLVTQITDWCPRVYVLSYTKLIETLLNTIFHFNGNENLFFDSLNQREIWSILQTDNDLNFDRCFKDDLIISLPLINCFHEFKQRFDVREHDIHPKPAPCCLTWYPTPIPKIFAKVRSGKFEEKKIFAILPSIYKYLRS